MEKRKLKMIEEFKRAIEVSRKAQQTLGAKGFTSVLSKISFEK